MKQRRFMVVSGIVGMVMAVLPAAGAQAAGLPCPTGITATMTKVNDFWIAHNANPKGANWPIGAYFAGDMAAARSLPNPRYATYAANWAAAQKFALQGGPTNTFADAQAAGQTYIELYQADPKHPASDIAQINQSVTSMIHSTKVTDWSWIDALFMSMPNFAKLGVIENNTAYFDKMFAEFHNTKSVRGLWNATKGLWWRDGTFVGQNTYWSRGNGWVIAAMARVLDVLPATDPHRAEYVQTLQQMAAALKAAQQPNGFWYVNLGNPADHPGPETSGTAFFTYGISWGIANGVLDPAVYQPVVTKAWNAMASVSVQPSGALGFVQGPGAKPSDGQPVTASSTQPYGVGAFLLAGTELSTFCH
jgi:rhamnogalacturonyl hydrolase YesR